MNFDLLYKELEKIYKNEILPLKKDYDKKSNYTILPIIAFILIVIYRYKAMDLPSSEVDFYYYLPSIIIFIITVVIAYFTFTKAQKKYYIAYNNKIIKRIMLTIWNDVNIYTYKGLRRNKYGKKLYSDKVTFYKSNNLVVINNNLTFSQIKAEYGSNDNYVITFDGIAGYKQLNKNTETIIRVIDRDTFEKKSPIENETLKILYKIKTKNEQICYKLLTPAVQEKLADFSLRYHYEFAISNNTLYYRVHKVKLLNDYETFSYNDLKECYNVLLFIYSLTSFIEKQVDSLL